MLLAAIVDVARGADGSSVLTIAAATAEDYCVGGVKWTQPNLPGRTLLYDRDKTGITCTVQGVDVAYLLTFHFVEPSMQAAGLRAFRVTVNDVVVFDSFDLYASCGYLTSCTRTILAMASDGALRIRFITQARSALFEAIDVRFAFGDLLLTSWPLTPAQ